PELASGTFHFRFLFASQVTGGSPCGAVPLASGPRQWCQLSSRSGGTSPADAATVAPKRIRAGISFFIAHSLRDQSATAFPREYIGTFARFRRKHPVTALAPLRRLAPCLSTRD